MIARINRAITPVTPIRGLRVAWTDPRGRVTVGRIVVTGGRARLIDDTGRIVNRRA